MFDPDAMAAKIKKLRQQADSQWTEAESLREEADAAESRSDKLAKEADKMAADLKLLQGADNYEDMLDMLAVSRDPRQLALLP